MKSFEVNISDEELSALEWDILDIQEWIANAISVKSRWCMNKLVVEYTDKNPKKLNLKEIKALVSTLTFVKAKDKEIGILGEM